MKIHVQTPITLLASKQMLEVEDELMEHMGTAARGLSVKELPWSLHYHAGRGVNRHTGRALVSLMPPVLPRTHEHHTLAAAFPYDPQARKRAHHHLLRSEHLQLLHRGRQAATRLEHGDTAARIITAYDPDLPPGTCHITDYEPKLRYTPKSRLPRWRDAVEVVAGELLDLFGGVPSKMLSVVGLVKSRSNEAEDKLHRQALCAALQCSDVQPDTELGYWVQHGVLLRFSEAGTYKSNTNVLDKFMKETLRLTRTQKSHVVMYKGQRISTALWVFEGTGEKAVLAHIYS